MAPIVNFLLSSIFFSEFYIFIVRKFKIFYFKVLNLIFDLSCRAGSFDLITANR